MIRMGLIGTGTMGAMYAAAYRQYERAKLVAVCDLDEQKADDLAGVDGLPRVYPNHAQMLATEDLDAVTVATPDAHHRGPVIDCAEAGLAVLCEKPLATTMEDCHAMRDAVRTHGIKLMVNYGNRHKRKVYALKERIARGELGRVETAFIQLREPIHKTVELAWLEQTTPTFFLLSHCTDTVTYLLGALPCEVYAKATYGVLRDRGIETPDAVVAMLTFPDGAVVTMDANWIMPDGFAPEIDFSLEMVGDKGAAYCKLRSEDFMLYTDRAQAVDYNISARDPFGFAHGWWNSSVYYFVECVRRGIDPVPDVDDGLNVTRVLLAIEESAREGKAVSLK